MKIDGGISGSGAEAGALEEAGYDGAWVAELNNDPFLPIVTAAERTSTLELGTGIAVAFARSPMTLAQTAYDLQRRSRGSVHPRPRFPDQTPHHQAVLHALVEPGGPHAGDDLGHPGHLGLLGR